MIVITASMPRSGSGWYTHLHQDLFSAAGYPETYTKSLREQFGSQAPKRIDRLESYKLAMLARVPDDSAPCFIKTHQRPTAGVLRLLTTGRAKATYIFRDPRDVVVSALELGKKLRERQEAKRFFIIGPYRSFARFYTVQDAVRWVNWQLFPRWKKWCTCPGVKITRYEDLVTDKLQELSKLAEFLSLDLDHISLTKILSKYEPQVDGVVKDDHWRPGRGSLLNKGISGRYMTSMSEREIDYCNDRLGPCLVQMGYL